MPHEIAVFFFCLVASGFFSGSEIALLSANRLRLRQLAHGGDGAAERVLQLVHDPRRLLAGILVGNNIVNVLAAVVAGTYFTRMLNPSLGPVVATAVATPMLVLFSEFLPKTIAALHPISFSRRVEKPVRWTLILLWPLVRLLDAITRPLAMLIGHGRVEASSLAQVRLAVADGVRTGSLEPTTARVLEGGLSLEWKQVGHILVPRVDVVCVPKDRGFRECLEMFRDYGYSRLLVIDETADQDLGYLAAKDLILLPQSQRAAWTAEKAARQALRVPASLALPELLARMRRSGVHFAVVKDEYGGTEGIATMEDVLEELVGEIRDEHDDDEVSPVVQLRDGLWLVRGDVSVKDLENRTGVNLPEEEARTVGGYCAEALGRLPHQGDVVEIDDARLVVVRVREKRVLQVRLVIPETE